MLAWRVEGAGFESPQDKNWDLREESLRPSVGKILCSPSPPEENTNQGPFTPIPTTQSFFCEELKSPDTPPKVVP